MTPKAKSKPVRKKAAKKKPAKARLAKKTPPKRAAKPKPKQAKKAAPAPKKPPARKANAVAGAKKAAAPEPDGGSHAVAEMMARKQKEISVSEFFAKNRHLLGFDNPRKALLTTVKEAVDNALDACEEARILPELWVAIAEVGEGRYRVEVTDNGPGIVKAQIPNIFGKLLYGSKFHRLKMSRGQQGIGISAAGMYGQLTTGQPISITSRTSPRRPAHHYCIEIDTQKNTPRVVVDETVEWEIKRGTKVEIVLEAKYQKGRQSVDEYLEQTAIANPHVQLHFATPDGEAQVYKRASDQLPEPTKEIQPHPHGVELGLLIKMMHDTKCRTLRSLLQTEFSRVSARVAMQICGTAQVSERARPSRIAREEADALFRAIGATKIMNPPTDCLSPIGEELMLAGLKKQIKADLYAAVSRPPAVYRGNPFQIEAGIAFGGELPADGLARVLRFANRVPLLYQQSACAISRSAISTGWRGYGLQQSAGALPSGPLIVMVHMASVWVPFTSESKEAIAHYPEIIKEIRLALQECGRRLSVFVRRRRKAADAERKQTYIQRYIPHIAAALREMLDLSERQEKAIVRDLGAVLERSRK